MTTSLSFDPRQVLLWRGGEAWEPVPDIGQWMEWLMSKTTTAAAMSENDKKVTEWLGWDEDQGQPWESDEHAAQRLVEELHERGYRVTADGSTVKLLQGKKVAAYGSGRHTMEALVKAVVRLMV